MKMLDTALILSPSCLKSSVVFLVLLHKHVLSACSLACCKALVFWGFGVGFFFFLFGYEGYKHDCHVASFLAELII